jgi:hypothetical protein
MTVNLSVEPLLIKQLRNKIKTLKHKKGNSSEAPFF